MLLVDLQGIFWPFINTVYEPSPFQEVICKGQCVAHFLLVLNSGCDDNQTLHCVQQVRVHAESEFTVMCLNCGEHALCISIAVWLPQA